MYDEAMPGAPQIREAALLVLVGAAPHDEHVPRLLFARLQEQVEDPFGWTVELLQCQRPGRKARRWYATEAEARAALQAVYTLGEAIGTWRRARYDAEPRGQQIPSTSSPGFRRTTPRRAGRSSGPTHGLGMK